jgi:Mn-containing catalase
MFYHDRKLQYKVKVDKPNPHFAKMLQQAIGGVEGEIRVMMQYMFQAWSQRGDFKYRDMLLDTGTEEIAHIEMLATAVALNLEGAPANLKDQMAGESPMVKAIMGGEDPRHILSSGLGATASDANGVPFNGSWVISTGNIASDMIANVHAEASGRLLATRLYEMTDDAGMKDLLAFLIARDTMHQNQWLAVIEELGGLQNVLPVPNSFPQAKENSQFNYTFVSTNIDRDTRAQGRWTQGRSIDGKGEFNLEYAEPLGGEPVLSPPEPQTYAQTEQMMAAKSPNVIEKLVDKLTPD